MLIVDDILFFPVRSILWIFREIHKVAQQELANEKDRIIAELSALYMMLDTGQITEEEFTAREQELLDRLDEIEKNVDEDKDDDDDENENEDEGEKEHGNGG